MNPSRPSRKPALAGGMSFLRALEKATGAWTKSQRHMVGVSGGRDSVALLHALHALSFTRLTVCHLDHGLRGRSGAADARFVKKLCLRLGLNFLGDTADAKAFAASHKLSLETAARKVRYDFFERCARQTRCPRLVLAHHADDQVETALFHFLRGSGMSGLAGMRPRSERGRLIILRPLLGVWREEIDVYVAGKKLNFREDASNADPAHTRNRLRNTLLPQLESLLGRDVRNAILRNAEILGEENAWLETLVPTQTESLRVKPLAAEPVALQRRVLHAWLRAAAVPLVGFDLVESVRELLNNLALAKVNLPGDRHVRRRAGILFIE